jgi:hypothetical protein
MIYMHVRNGALDGVTAKLWLVLPHQVFEEDLESALLVAPHHKLAVCTDVFRVL